MSKFRTNVQSTTGPVRTLRLRHAGTRQKPIWIHKIDTLSGHMQAPLNLSIDT